MEGRDMLKQLAKRAKERLSGKPKMNGENKKYINKTNIVTIKIIENDEKFCEKVEKIVKNDTFCPINDLIDFDYYKKLSNQQKEKYFFELANKFRKEKEKILSKKLS